MTSALYDSYKVDVANKDGIQVIHNQEILGQEFRVYGNLENPIFLAKEVAEWIEHTNTSKMLSSVDTDEKVKHILPITNGYTQEHGGARANVEVWFLTEDGLYEILMQSRKPIAKQFKKKVKQLLKDLRLNKSNPYANMSKELQAIFMLDNKQQELENKVNYIEDKMTVNYELAENLRSAINIRAVELLDGKGSKAYKVLNRRLYSAFHKDIKKQFKVNSYKNLSIKNYDDAVSFIAKWQPDELLIYAIQGVNSQITFN